MSRKALLRHRQMTLVHPGAAFIYPGVVWGGEYSLGPFVIVGHPSRGGEPGDMMTTIGPDAVIRSHTVVYYGNRIGSRFQTGHGVLIREANEIADDVSIGSGTVVEHHVRIGHRVRLHSNVFLPEFSVLEDDSWVGPNVVFTNAKYPCSRRAKEELIGPHIEQAARIGANATLLPGVRIGRHALVGAGSVVTKNVPSGAVVAGNPARVINYVHCLPYEGLAPALPRRDPVAPSVQVWEDDDSLSTETHGRHDYEYSTGRP
jgi:acetyltransferase-like isoleucine patch superfamily enzyme